MLFRSLALIVEQYITELSEKAGDAGFTYESEGRIKEYKASFKDVPFGHWSHEYIEKLAAGKVVNGYADGLFRPDNKVTRRHAAKMVAVAAGLPYEGLTADFPDVPKDDEMSPYIAALTVAEAIRGYTDGNFRPGENITRGHIAKIVVEEIGRAHV